MRFDDLNAILNSTLEPLERLVLVAVASHINSDGAKAWPSIERLAQMTGLNKSTVTDRIAKMQAAGVLVRRRRFAQSSVYEIATIPQLTATPLNGHAVDTATPLSDTANDHLTATPTIIRRPHRKELSNEPSKENNPIGTRPDPKPDDLDLFNDQPAQPVSDRSLIQGLAGYVTWGAKDPDRLAENIAEAASLVREHGATTVLEAAKALSLAIGRKAYPSELSEHFIALRAQERLTEAPPERYIDPIIAQALSTLDIMGYSKASGCYDHGRKSEDQFREMLEHNQGAALEFIAAADQWLHKAPA